LHIWSTKTPSSWLLTSSAQLRAPLQLHGSIEERWRALRQLLCVFLHLQAEEALQALFHWLGF
jgi:hypothetical protein